MPSSTPLMIRAIPVAEGERRVDSGAVRFGNDWPGVFIRGDEALNLAGRLAAFGDLSQAARFIVIADVVGLLRSCFVEQH